MVQERPGFDPEGSVKDRGPVAGFFFSGWTNLVRMMASNALSCFDVFTFGLLSESFRCSDWHDVRANTKNVKHAANNFLRL